MQNLIKQDKAKSIVMLGTAYDTMGGISSVVNVYRQAGLFDHWPIEYIATHRDGSKFAKLSQAVKAILRLSHLLIIRRVAILHVHLSKGPSFWRKNLYIWLARFFHVPYMLHLHGGGFPDFLKNSNGLSSRLICNAFKHAAIVIVLSEEWKDWVANTFNIINIRVIPNPVAIPTTSSKIREVATLLFLGRLGKNKGIYDLLPAMVKIAPQFPELRLLAGGDGELDKVRAEAEALGISDKVEILGWIRGEQKDALLARAAIYVLPSYAENLPMGILEAMAAGMPIISTPVGGIPSAVEDGVEGCLVPPGDVDALAEALYKLLADSSLRKRMGEAALAKANAKFSAGKVIADLAAVYRESGIVPMHDVKY